MAEAQQKPSMISFQINVPVLAAMILTVYLAFSAHSANMENTKKINQLLVKYEKALDTAIINDPALFKTYQQNLSAALNDLSPEEKRILEAVTTLAE